MLITKGKPNPSEPWRILEVAIGQSPDVLAIRLSRELKRIHEPAIQALVPMRRNSEGDPEWIIEHVYVRGVNGSLSKLANIHGIDFIRPEFADNVWIDTLLKQSQLTERASLRAGSFVRVLTGPCARMCGHVLSIHELRVTVLIRMKTKKVLVHTFPENLQAIHCPADQQVFFYSAPLFS